VAAELLSQKLAIPVIKANMKIEKALLAGELSGHIFFADKYYGFDDGIYAGMRMIDLLSRNSYSLANLYEKMPKLYNTPEIKIKVEESKKFEIVESIKTWCIESKRKFLDIDGVRYSNENGWWLVRASNTEPALTLRFESISQDGLGMLQQDLNNILQSFGIINTK
jgi:phosphomannomutase